MGGGGRDHTRHQDEIPRVGIFKFSVKKIIINRYIINNKSMKRKASEGVFPRCQLQISTVGSCADVSFWRKQRKRKITK